MHKVNEIKMIALRNELKGNNTWMKIILEITAKKHQASKLKVAK